MEMARQAETAAHEADRDGGERDRQVRGGLNGGSIGKIGAEDRYVGARRQTLASLACGGIDDAAIVERGRSPGVASEFLGETADRGGEDLVAELGTQIDI